jgi:spermidine/putrescine transport system ATP-binding protein
MIGTTPNRDTPGEGTSDAGHPSTPAVSLQGISCAFGATRAVDDLNLDLSGGEFFSLIGASGCGKSTTLRMIAGLQQPTEGRIMIAGRDVTDLSPEKREVNTVFQHYALFPHLDVFENVAFGLRERRVAKTELSRRVGEMLDLVGLADRGRSKIRELSGGQQQRVALGRSLILEPAVLLLDEPLGALDLKLRRQMQLVLKQVQSRVGITFLYVTHDQEEAFAMSDRVGVMDKGVLAQVGTPQDIYRRPASPFVADFVGASNRLGATIAGGGPDGYELVLEADGRRLRAPGCPNLVQGSRVGIIVRPEAFRFGGGEGNELTGTLVDASFLGSQTVYTIAVEQCGDLTVAEGRPTSPMPAPGEQARIAFASEDAWVVPA